MPGDVLECDGPGQLDGAAQVDGLSPRDHHLLLSDAGVAQPGLRPRHVLQQPGREELVSSAKKQLLALICIPHVTLSKGLFFRLETPRSPSTLIPVP